jgi:energy-converting hydrogenase A subunit M
MANKTMAVASLSVCMLCLLMQITLHLNSIYQDHGMVEQHQMRCHGFKLLHFGLRLAKLEILDFDSGLKSQEPGAEKEFHRNLVLVHEETPEY